MQESRFQINFITYSNMFSDIEKNTHIRVAG